MDTPFMTAFAQGLAKRGLRVHIHWLIDGDHSFKPRKSSGRTEEDNLRQGIQTTAEFVAQL
jgi:predicted alpha/beta-hydrolase family hydrolase